MARCDRATADPRSWRATRLIIVLGCALAAGCGSSTPGKPVAERICGGSGRAAASVLHGPVTARITGRDVTNVTCTLSGGGRRVLIVSQAGSAAYTAFDTETSHQAQVYGSGVHEVNRTPVQIIVPRAVAAVWVPGQAEIIATNAIPTRPGGAYVTVNVNGRHLRVDAARTLARALATAIFAARPATK